MASIHDRLHSTVVSVISNANLDLFEDATRDRLKAVQAMRNQTVFSHAMAPFHNGTTLTNVTREKRVTQWKREEACNIKSLVKEIILSDKFRALDVKARESIIALLRLMGHVQLHQCGYADMSPNIMSEIILIMETIADHVCCVSTEDTVKDATTAILVDITLRDEYFCAWLIDPEHLDDETLNEHYAVVIWNFISLLAAEPKFSDFMFYDTETNIVQLIVDYLDKRRDLWAATTYNILTPMISCFGYVFDYVRPTERVIAFIKKNALLLEFAHTSYMAMVNHIYDIESIGHQDMEMIAYSGILYQFTMDVLSTSDNVFSLSELILLTAQLTNTLFVSYTSLLDLETTSKTAGGGGHKSVPTHMGSIINRAQKLTDMFQAHEKSTLHYTLLVFCDILTLHHEKMKLASLGLSLAQMWKTIKVNDPSIFVAFFNVLKCDPMCTPNMRYIAFTLMCESLAATDVGRHNDALKKFDVSAAVACIDTWPDSTFVILLGVIAPIVEISQLALIWCRPEFFMRTLIFFDVCEDKDILDKIIFMVLIALRDVSGGYGIVRTSGLLDAFECFKAVRRDEFPELIMRSVDSTIKLFAHA